MATYTNLTTLKGLSVGDIILYDTETTIDLAGFGCKFEVVGNSITSGNYGGYSCGTMSSKANASITFNTTYSSCFYLTNSNGTDWRYNRFIVAGNAAVRYMGVSYYSTGGAGGGETAGDGGYNGYSSYKGTGGTQSSGGGFGAGGTGSGGPGGAGWYGGTAGGYSYSSRADGSGGGGSGYVLTETSYKPDGYMSDYTFTLTDTTLTTGGASSYSSYGFTSLNQGKITIVEDAFDPDTQTMLIYSVRGEVTEQIINQGSTIESPGTPEVEGYIFCGWYADSQFVDKYTFGGTATADYIYIYAKMLKITDLTIYKLIAV